MSDLSISISCQVSSLGVVTCGCHTTTHLRCNGEVLPETHGTHLLEADFLSQPKPESCTWIYMDYPQNTTLLHVVCDVCGNLLKFGDI